MKAWEIYIWLFVRKGYCSQRYWTVFFSSIFARPFINNYTLIFALTATQTPQKISDDSSKESDAIPWLLFSLCCHTSHHGHSSNLFDCKYHFTPLGQSNFVSSLHSFVSKCLCLRPSKGNFMLCVKESRMNCFVAWKITHTLLLHDKFISFGYVWSFLGSSCSFTENASYSWEMPWSSGHSYWSCEWVQETLVSRNRLLLVIMILHQTLLTLKVEFPRQRNIVNSMSCKEHILLDYNQCSHECTRVELQCSYGEELLSE
jgi:hypothetical protein